MCSFSIWILDWNLDSLHPVHHDGRTILARGGGTAVGFSDHDQETMNAIEREVDYLQRLMAADEGYQEGYQAEPEIDADGPNQMNDAQ